MARLINADYLKGCKILKPYKGESVDNVFIREIELDDIPTAFDVENVVEQINGMEVVLSVDDISADNLKFTNKILRLVKDGAIERIRKGGV